MNTAKKLKNDFLFTKSWVSIKSNQLRQPAKQQATTVQDEENQRYGYSNNGTCHS